MQKLHTIIYKSKANHIPTQNELTALAKTAYFNNFIYKISGLLIYSNQVFLQVLEGRQELVEMVFEAIKNDDRHHQITVIKNEPLAERAFEQWSMGLVVVEPGSELEAKLQKNNSTIVPFNTMEELRIRLILDTFSKKVFHKFIQ